MAGSGSVAPPIERRAAVRWLLERHPDVASVLRRFGTEAVESAFALPEVFFQASESDRAWREYEDHHPPPLKGAGYGRWHEAGPVAGAAVEVLGVLSGGELRAMRMVAMLTGRVAIGVGDLYGLDFPASHSDFVNDWLQVVATGAGRW